MLATRLPLGRGVLLVLAECCRVPVHGEVEGVEEGRKDGPGPGWLAA